MCDLSAASPSTTSLVLLLISSDLFLFSCSRRSCSSLSRCSRACLRFSASTRAASSGSLVPAEGLLADAAGAEEEEEEEGAAEAVGLGGGADASMAGAAGEATAAAGGLGEGGEAGLADTTMAGRGLEPGAETAS